MLMREVKIIKSKCNQWFFLTVFIFTLNTSFGAVWHVDANNQTLFHDGTEIYPFANISDAINIADNFDTIKVAQGIYNENLLIIYRKLILLGSFEGGSNSDYTAGSGGDFINRDYQTYITEIHGLDTSAVIEFRYECNNSVVDGFVISGGHRGILLDNDYTWPPHENIIISNNTIENNGWDTLDNEVGGGICVNGSYITVENNIIRNNRAGRGGALSANGQNNLLRYNLIDNNWANSDHGGGLYLYGKTIITDNVISNNRVGVLSGYGWGGAVIFFATMPDTSISSGNIYFNNHAPTYGGAVFVDDEATVYMNNDLVYNNYAEDHTHAGGGIAVDQGTTGTPSYLYVDNCTVAGNYNTQNVEGNGIYLDANTSVTVKNSIFWNNGGDFKIHPTSTLAVTYSISEDTINGNGVLHLNPLFADIAHADYHLLSQTGRFTDSVWVSDTQHSPAIDTGDPASDYSKETAPNGNRVNLGCYGNTSEASRSLGTFNPLYSTNELYFKCIPNPFCYDIKLYFMAKEIGIYSIDLINLLGTKVKTYDCYISQPGEQEKNITIDDLSDAFYTLVLRKNGVIIYCGKLVKDCIKQLK